MKVWRFRYKKGPAPVTTGDFEASNERIAIAAAAHWCVLNNARFIGGSVEPAILFDESILKTSIEPEAAALPDPVTATTNAHVAE